MVIIIDCTHDVFKCGEYVDVAHFPTLRYYRDKKLQKAWTTELDMMTVEDISDLVIRSIDDIRYIESTRTWLTLIDEKVSQWATHPAIITMKPQDTEPREAVEAIDSDCVLLFLFDPKMAVAARPLYELAQDIEYRETVPLVVGTVNGTSPFGLAFSTWAGLKQFDRAQWVLVNHNE
ncbi:unnamed protein product, partial [Mesorhabditis spiculigera]